MRTYVHVNFLPICVRLAFPLRQNLRTLISQSIFVSFKLLISFFFFVHFAEAFGEWPYSSYLLPLLHCRTPLKT
ncbi:hypothetical protein ACOSQ2_023108 [Xanthoceras sorbifolium]